VIFNSLKARGNATKSWQHYREGAGMDDSMLKTVAKRNSWKFWRAFDRHTAAALDAEHRLRQTRALLGGVDRRTREIYIAHRSGSTYPEIAADWGISNEIIRTSVARALLAIMEHGEQTHDDESS
jgi:DNA-binding IclR family transcriptional regulator